MQKKSQESQKRRKERMENITFLRTRVVESKKIYSRKKIKQELSKGDF
ncbi:MAG: hypothetical protein J6R47_01870 [Acholeplasmatales bacterium]|nr:hypothetical protein [Acholeplasmatales bacterium]